MPTYDYECVKCAHKFEVFQSIKDEPIANCEKCGEKARRLISSGIGIIFKGSGFYVNDYKGKGKGCAAAASGDSKSESAPSPACASCSGEPCGA
jgi:putative FmdB family regulatory protein